MRRADRRRAALWLLAGLVIVLRVWQARTATVWNDDFDVYWHAGRTALRWGDPWVTGFVYLPAALVAFLPLGLLPLAVAEQLWLAVSTALVVGSAVAVARQVRLPIPAVLLVTFLAFPTESALQFGNVTVVELALLVAAASAVRAGAWWRVALLLGLGIALKPVLVPCLLVLALRRRWAELGAALGGPLVVSGLVLVVVGNGTGWLSAVRRGLTTAGGDPASADLRSVVEHVGAAAWTVPVAMVSVLLIAVIGLRRWEDVDTLHLPMIASFLIGSVCWAHYPLLLLPLVAAWIAAGGRWRWAAWGAVVLWTLPEVAAGRLFRAVPPAEIFVLFTLGLVVLLLAASIRVSARAALPA